MSKRFFTPMALLSATLTACAPLPLNYAFENDRSVIAFPEIQRTEARSAFDLVRRTRPNFLSSRGLAFGLGSSSSLPTLYVNGVRYGPIEMLSDIPASAVEEIRFYRLGESGQFGSGNPGGVLMVRTRRR